MSLNELCAVCNARRGDHNVDGKCPATFGADGKPMTYSSTLVFKGRQVSRVFNKYQKEVKDIDGRVIGNIDVYSVLSAFNVTEPGLQHAIKKLLMPGQRGKGGFKADLKEAVQSIERTIITAQESE